MENSNSRENFELGSPPRLGRSGFQSRMAPFLADITVLVLKHYTPMQIREWLVEYKGLTIGRHAVGRFVKRIQVALARIGDEPSTRVDAVLSEVIRKAAASMQGSALLPVSSTQWRVGASKMKNRPTAAVLKGVSDSDGVDANPAPRDGLRIASPCSDAREFHAISTPKLAEASAVQQGISECDVAMKPMGLADKYAPERRVPTTARVQEIVAQLKGKKARKAKTL